MATDINYARERKTVRQQVPDGAWYYLLDWNERDDWVTINEIYKRTSLSELTLDEFWDFFALAASIDIGKYYPRIKIKITIT